MEDSKYQELLSSIRQGDQVKFEREIDVVCRSQSVPGSSDSENSFSIWKCHYKKPPCDTLLHVLAHHGRTAMIQFLVEKLEGADFLNVTNSEGKTALHEAAQFSQVEVVKFLLDQNGCQVDALKRADWTPLMLASTRTGEESGKVIKLLLEKGAKLSLVNKDGWTAFHLAAREGDVGILRIFVATDSKAWNTVSKNGRTPLHTACLAGHLGTVKFLIDECGHEIDCFDSCKSTPLMDGAKAGHLDVLGYLLARGADPLARDAMDRTCLDVGAHCGQAEAVAFLLDHFGQRGHQLPKVGPLHWAAKEGHESVVKTLLSSGLYSVHDHDLNGRSALEMAIGGQHVAATEALLANAEHLFDLRLLGLARVPALVSLLTRTFESWNVHLFYPTTTTTSVNNEDINSHIIIR